MTDRELLELAAKAVGLPPEGYEGGPGGVMSKGGLVWSGSGRCIDWSPLTDDGDALRLAVRLEIDLCFGANYVIAGGEQVPTVNNANDPCAATRHAIVRAAAEVGKAMP